MFGITEGQLLGLASIGIGLVTLVVNLVSRKRLLWLLRHGSEIDAEIVRSDARYLDGDTWFRTYVWVNGDHQPQRVLMSYSQFEPGTRIKVICDLSKLGPVVEADKVEQWRPDRGVLSLNWRWWPAAFLVFGTLMIVFPVGDPLGG